MAIAISMYYMSQQIGIALGISISSALLKQEFKTTLQKTLIVVPNYQEVGPILPLSNKRRPNLQLSLVDYQKHTDGFFCYCDASY
jgi:hypothetical protein